MSDSLQTRLEKLEVLYSEQDHIIQALNDMVADQSQEISRLRAEIELIREQLRSLKQDANDGTGSEFEIPPHY